MSIALAGSVDYCKRTRTHLSVTQKWKQTNPWTATNIPAIEEAVVYLAETSLPMRSETTGVGSLSTPGNTRAR